MPIRKRVRARRPRLADGSQARTPGIHGKFFNTPQGHCTRELVRGTRRLPNPDYFTAENAALPLAWTILDIGNAERLRREPSRIKYSPSSRSTA